MENCLGGGHRRDITATGIVDQYTTSIAAAQRFRHPAPESHRGRSPHTRVVEPVCSVVVLDGPSHRRTFKDGVVPARSVFSRWNSLGRRLALPEGLTTLPPVHRQLCDEDGLLRCDRLLVVAHCV